MDKFIAVVLVAIFGLSSFPSQKSAKAQCENGQCRRALFVGSQPVEKVVTTQVGSSKITCRREGVVCKARQFRPMRRVGAYVVTHKPVRKGVKRVFVGSARVVKRVGRVTFRVVTFPGRAVFGRR